MINGTKSVPYLYQLTYLSNFAALPLPLHVVKGGLLNKEALNLDALFGSPQSSNYLLTCNKLK